MKSIQCGQVLQKSLAFALIKQILVLKKFMAVDSKHLE